MHNTTFSRFVPTEHRDLGNLQLKFNLPDVPIDVIRETPQSSVRADDVPRRLPDVPRRLPDVRADDVPRRSSSKMNILKGRNPHNHLLMFYALFIFDFLHNYFEYTKKLCKIIKIYKSREISYNRLLNAPIQKAYEELKKIYDDKQFAASEDILKTIIGEIPVLLNTIHSILKDINIFNAIWGYKHSIDSENSENRIELVKEHTEYKRLNEQMNIEYGSSIQIVLNLFSVSEDINKESIISIQLNNTLPSLISYVNGIGIILRKINLTLMKNTPSESKDLFEGMNDSLTQVITKLIEGSEMYKLLVKSGYFIEVLDNKMRDLQSGGRRKPTTKPKKSNHADMNMKDIRRLCKANQIKLSTTKDGVRIIYKKKELITKLKRKKIL